MVKKPRAIKCEKCGLEFPESVMSGEHKDKAFICRDCLSAMGSDPRIAETVWSLQKEQKAKPHDW
jgi:peptide subunit release factor 1 (eRF1)